MFLITVHFLYFLSSQRSKRVDKEDEANMSARFFYTKNFCKKTNLKNPKILRKC